LLLAAVVACYSISFWFEGATECEHASEIRFRGMKESVGDWATRGLSDEEVNDIRAAVESIARSHGLERHQIKEGRAIAKANWEHWSHTDHK
jgi:hypothetical protein